MVFSTYFPYNATAGNASHNRVPKACLKLNKCVGKRCCENARTTCEGNAEKCSKNDRLTTESCTDQNYDNPNCRKEWHSFFFCGVPRLWLSECLLDWCICPSLLGLESSRIVHLIAGISRLCHVTAYYFLQSYENMVLTIWSIVSYHFLPALSCPIVSNLKPAMAAMTTFSPRPPCAIHIWT